MRGIQLTKNFLEYSIGTFQYVIIPKPDYPKSFRFKKSGSLGIAGSLFRMLPAIQFYYQLLFETDEINDVRWKRMLSPKLELAEVAILQVPPKAQFRVG